MKTIILYLLIVFIFSAKLLASFGIHIGSYSSKPNIPSQIQQLNLPTQVVEQNGQFQLLIGPFDSQEQAQSAQKNFNLQGNIIEYSPSTPPSSSQAQGFAVEILSSKDINTVPKRIVNQVFDSGMSPSFIMDQGMYRLVVGPFSSQKQAQNASAALSNLFGRSMSIINVPPSRFSSAIRPQKLTPEELARSGVPVSSRDNNEHVGFLENQRSKAIDKYSTRPYGATTSRVVNSLAPYNNTISTREAQDIQTESIISDKSGVLLSISAISSKHEFAVNGKQIKGQFSPGFQLGFKINDNTLIQASYFAPEIKQTTVFIQNSQAVEVTSSYSFLSSLELKYRYFLPSLNSVFMTSNMGMNFVKQVVNAKVPLNFGSTYTAPRMYTQVQFGIGTGYRLGRRLSVGIDYNAHITLKTISNNVKLYLNLEF